MNESLDLFLTFFKLGLTTFGGGYAMLPLIKENVVEKKKWLTDEQLLEIFAIAESTPGPVAINTATYVGYKRKGVLGSFLATLGVVLPSFIIIFVISLFLDAFLANKYIAYAFVGIKCAVAYLILKAGFNLITKMKKDPLQITLFILVTIAMILFDIFSINFSSIIFIIIGAILGISIYSLQAHIKNKKLKKDDIVSETVSSSIKKDDIEKKEESNDINDKEEEIKDITSSKKDDSSSSKEDDE